MSANDAVGKKIVEALKKQSEPELELVSDVVEKEQEADAFTISDDAIISEPKVEDVVLTDNNVANREDKFEIKEETVSDNFMTGNNEGESAKFENAWNFESVAEHSPMFQNDGMYSNVSVAQTKQFNMPPNVTVLKKLIAQLPTGVTKQTGAQIIKQTMEALGISMNTVLHEAQKVQDDMNESIKNCMLTIQEYKNNIKNLEKQGMDYQRQVNQLNDLISLFILSDKD